MNTRVSSATRWIAEDLQAMLDTLADVQILALNIRGSALRAHYVTIKPPTTFPRTAAVAPITSMILITLLRRLTVVTPARGGLLVPAFFVHALY